LFIGHGSHFSPHLKVFKGQSKHPDNDKYFPEEQELQLEDPGRLIVPRGHVSHLSEGIEENVFSRHIKQFILSLDEYSPILHNSHPVCPYCGAILPLLHDLQDNKVDISE
jgi:hypothetical protein